MPSFKDLFFIPTVATMLRQDKDGGVATVSLVFNQQTMFIIPRMIQSGGGRTLNTKTFTIDGQQPHKALHDLLESGKAGMAYFDKWLKEVDLDPDYFKIPVGGPENFIIKAGWVGGSLRFLSSVNNRWYMMSIGKKHAKELLEFLGRQA